MYFTSLVALLRTWNTFLKGLRDTFKTRKRIHRHLKYYVGCYFGYWTLVLACYALFSVLPKEDKAGSSDNQGGLRCRVWHFLTCLLLAKGMVNSLIWTRTSNILKVIEQLREFGYVDLPAHEDNINWALRLEILTNTTKGICESIDRAEQQARASGASSSSSSSLDEGIHGASEYDYCDRKESYTQIEEIILENRNDRSSRGPRSEGVVFYDYAPHVFRQQRIAAKISCASYRNSLRQTTKERVSEGKSGAFFYFTEDRRFVVKTMTHEELKFLLSMLPKYYTYIRENPNTFVTRYFGCHALTMYGKTVFFMVMQSVFDTTLQIHERFDLKGSWVGRLEGRKPTGTVATCKFCNAEYVVGGSHDQLCDVRRGEGNLRHQYDQVGKDLNWNRHMALPRGTARSVARQLVRDSDFLCRINCIDYSLLVGIHHRSFNVSHYSSADSSDASAGCRASCSSIGSRSSSNGTFGPGSKPFHQTSHGGMNVDEVHGPGIYFMGLIDMLQQWNFRKRLEHVVRVYLLMQDRHGISVVNPRQYAERFQQRVVRELIYDESHDFEDSDTFLQHQLQLQEQHDLQLFQSGRTLSTVLDSFDMSSCSERGSSLGQNPCVIPVRIAAPKKTGKRVSTSHAVLSPVEKSIGPSPKEILMNRISGGFEMVYSPRNSTASRPSMQTILTCHGETIGCCGETPCYGLPIGRRSLAPLTPSPRATSTPSDGESSHNSPRRQRRGSWTTTTANGHPGPVPASPAPSSPDPSSRNGLQSTGPAREDSARSGATIAIAADSVPDSPHSYRIVRTPTFPSTDKASSTLSA